MPMVKIRFRPWISAIRPKGTRNMAAASRYDVGIQLRSTAFMPSSLPMTGIAMFTDETMNGVRNEAMTAMRSAVRFVEASCMASAELSDEREENAEEQAYDNARGQGKR